MYKQGILGRTHKAYFTTAQTFSPTNPVQRLRMCGAIPPLSHLHGVILS